MNQKKVASRCQGTAESCPNHPDFRDDNNTLAGRVTKFYKYCPCCYIAIQRAMMPRPLSPLRLSISLDNKHVTRCLDASVSPPSHRARPKDAAESHNPQYGNDGGNDGGNDEKKCDNK